MANLTNPITINLTLNTEEDVLALLWRANLDADNLREWYHGHRGKVNRIIPDVRFTELYKALKNVCDEQGIALESAEQDQTAAAPANTLNISAG